MKIAVISDMHLGYKSGTEREEDAFKQAEEAMDKALEKNIDLILLPGDIFDEKVPSPETMSRAIKILKKPLTRTKREVEIKELNKGKEQLSKSSVPIIAIHGTHERRSKGYVNPIQMLEDMGYLIHLHCNRTIVKVNGEEIAIHGMSGVPEEYTKQVLEKFNPRPVENMLNIFMFHQSLEEYIYDPENTFLKVNDLPEGFDLYIDGHIHQQDLINEDKTVLFPGSTVITQMRKIEAEKEKGFSIINTNGEEKDLDIDFVPIKRQRPFKYLEIELEGEKSSEIIERTREKIKEQLKEIRENTESDVKPMIKVKLKGEISETHAMHIDNEEITKNLDALIEIDKEYEAEGLKAQIESLREAQKRKKSIRQMGTEKLKEMLEDTDYDSMDPEELINLLSSKDATEVVKELMNRYEEEIEKEEDTEDKREEGETEEKVRKDGEEEKIAVEKEKRTLKDF